MFGSTGKRQSGEKASGPNTRGSGPRAKRPQTQGGRGGIVVVAKDILHLG
jgi:hypothetical protein